MGIGNMGLPGLLLIAVVVLVLFGRGKISSLMGEVGKGITSFKKGINDGQKELEEDASLEAKDITPDAAGDDKDKDNGKDKA
ncbi:MAG: twin-arginine translocase TatA/TatE family subunit [Rhodobacteraceae bacterium]|nr:twin-arginine translocase TatA/TatE family subunit [Paracoccaceae bacterium]